MAIWMTGAILGTAVALLAGEMWALTRLWGEGDQIRHRLDAVATAVAARTVPRMSAVAVAGGRAPLVALDNLTGETVRLASLLEQSRPVALIFTDPRCGPCEELLPDIRRWQETAAGVITLVLISAGGLEVNRAMAARYELANVFIQQELEIVAAYGVQQAPALVIVQPNGQVMLGPLYGGQLVRAVIEDLLKGRNPGPVASPLSPLTAAESRPAPRSGVAAPPLTGAASLGG